MNRTRDMNWIFLFTLFVYFGGSLVLGFTPVIADDILLALLYSQGILILPTLIYVVYKKKNIKEIIRFRRIKIANVFLLIVFSYLILPVMTLLNAISMLFSTNIIGNTVEEAVSKHPVYLTVLVVAVVPAIFEEVVYRGVFFNEYRKVSLLKGVFLSGLLFGLMHMNLNQFIYAFVMGVIFALVVEATDSILATMIMHFVINGTSVMIAYNGPEQGETNREAIAAAIDTYGMVALWTLPLAIIVFILIAKIQGRLSVVKNIFSRTETKNETEKIKEKLITAPLGVGIAICVILMLLTEITMRFLS